MVTRSTTDSATIDRLDRQILHGLQIAPRVAFARLGAVLGVSEQTVARRFQRMRSAGLVRVFGLAEPSRLPGTTSWSLRMTCRPGTATATAEALARRADTSWVAIGAGGVEVSCAAYITDDRHGVREGLLHHLPRSTNVLSLTAHQVLHPFVGRGEADWIAAGDQLGDADRDRLLEGTEPGRRWGSPWPVPGTPVPDVRIEPGDRALLAALAHDGRASYAALATATGWTQRKVALRLTALTAAGAIRFDIDAAVTLIGFRAVANLWFTVAPSDVAAVGARLADHRQLAWAAAVTGSANITATALCRDAESLYRYLTTEVAAIPEIRTCETIPLQARMKQAMSLVDGGVLRGPVG
ncbi:Lrp/AsnC family transcriptional regulator [Actinoplanes friuliensis]|uniref:Transcriptional regulator n=1 Tax=Actinoplanes friuliensis DSM 7358 TaxID=1246995 RepID=U5W8V0_9ACTN|nr:AsnC family transcriptional regulator [Actinoplanes friuliensis]AGZ44425.1 transcriptional regulator [Actinoplanes friuliensis DSM 7358]